MGHGRLRRRAAGCGRLVTTNHSDFSEITILIREKQVGLKITPGRRLFWAERRRLFPKRGSTGAGARSHTGPHGPTRAHTGSRAARGRGRPGSQGLSAPRPARPLCPRLGWDRSAAQLPGLGGFVTGNISWCPVQGSWWTPQLTPVDGGRHFTVWAGGRDPARQTGHSLTVGPPFRPEDPFVCKWPCTASQEEAKTKEAGVSTTGSPLTMCPVSVPRGRPRRTVTGPPDLGQRSGGRESGTWLGAVGQGPGEEPGGGVALGLGGGAMASEDLVKSASCYQGNFNAAGATTHLARAPTEALLWPGPPLCVWEPLGYSPGVVQEVGPLCPPCPRRPALRGRRPARPTVGRRPDQGREPSLGASDVLRP